MCTSTSCVLCASSVDNLDVVFFFNGFGLCMLYFIVFGDTFATFIASLFEGESLWSVWWTHRWVYSLPLAVLLLPVVLKKELAEFAWISYILFVSLGLFVLTNFIELVFKSSPFEVPSFTAGIFAISDLCVCAFVNIHLLRALLTYLLQ